MAKSKSEQDDFIMDSELGEEISPMHKLRLLHQMKALKD